MFLLCLQAFLHDILMVNEKFVGLNLFVKYARAVFLLKGPQQQALGNVSCDKNTC